MDELIRYDRGDDGIAALTLSDPPANTYSYEMMRQLDAAVLEARMDDGVHVLLLQARASGSSARAPTSRASRRPRRASNTSSVCTPTRP
jgi:enoyl-CoA hydratase/carnithine racemase